MPETTKATAKRKAPAKELAHITESLRPLAVHVSELKLDPRNARKHDQRSVDAVGKSLELYGQRKPVVANRQTGCVIAGNGTLQAVQARGWNWIAVVWVDDDPATATGYAIADNRTAELSEWDDAQLRELLGELDAAGVSHVDLGFTAAELDKLIEDATAGVGPPGHEEREAPDQSGGLKEKFQVVVDCLDEADQVSFLEGMKRDGRKCRVLNS